MPPASVLLYIADPASADFDALAERAARAGGAAADPAVRRVALAAVLAAAGIAGAGRRPVLALAPAPDAGGSRLADDLLAALADDATLRPIKPRGVDPVTTRSWLAARQRDGRPALVVGARPGLEGLLVPLERRGLRFRLPPASSLVALRGPEGAPQDELRHRLGERLGLAADRLWLAWEAPGVTTPFVARWDGENRFAIPHWTRVEAGADGGLVVTDLASWGGELRVATAASGDVAGDYFTLR